MSFSRRNLFLEGNSALPQRFEQNVYRVNLYRLVNHLLKLLRKSGIAVQVKDWKENELDYIREFGRVRGCFEADDHHAIIWAARRIVVRCGDDALVQFPVG